MTTRTVDGRVKLHHAIIMIPLERVADLPPYARVLGGVTGFFAILRGDLLPGILLLYVLAAGFDYWLGRLCAKRAKTFDPLLAQAGALTKLSSVVMIGLIRGFEAWAPGLSDMNGAVSAALAVGLFLMEIESIEHHRVELRARPIPGFSNLLALLRAVETRLFPPVSNPAPPPPPPPSAEMAG